ncbi:hypothetical protein C8R45DRAFT_944806 [Mycena sanguinolenta]|nr:hypothetical protein C8R45DRAFT_944806 [Mycena sanguinolenta]
MFLLSNGSEEIPAALDERLPQALIMSAQDSFGHDLHRQFSSYFEALLPLSLLHYRSLSALRGALRLAICQRVDWRHGGHRAACSSYGKLSLSAKNDDYPGQTRQGVSMRDLHLRGPSAPIQGANDFVLATTGLKRIVLRIIWPGYGHVEWCRTISVITNHAPITRASLGCQIASNFVRFVEKSDYESPTSRDWMISPSCVRFEHLYLVALHNTSDDVWQADVALDLA